MRSVGPGRVCPGRRAFGVPAKEEVPGCHAGTSVRLGKRRGRAYGTEGEMGKTEKVLFSSLLDIFPTTRYSTSSTYILIQAVPRPPPSLSVSLSLLLSLSYFLSLSLSLSRARAHTHTHIHILTLTVSPVEPIIPPAS